uniref:Uncharacterized protein n=1 Tax=Streptomyces sp. NBC_01393 TaxID=2903851 RepID=A0AAU3ICW7_9ACTN
MAVFLILAGAGASFGLPAGMTGVRRLGGEKCDFDSAVPLADFQAVLPAPGESLRRSFDAGFVVFSGLPCLVLGLAWRSWAVLFSYVFFAPERVAKRASVLVWERRRGVLL